MLLNAILPIFLLITLGYALNLCKILDDTFWHGAEKLTYYVLFPSLLIGKMSVADLSGIDIGPITLASLLSLTLITVITIAIKPLFNISDVSFSSVYQGAMRFNTYIGLALVSTLFGEEGLVIAVIIASILIPAVNVCAVISLQHYHPYKSHPHKNHVNNGHPDKSNAHNTTDQHKVFTPQIISTFKSLFKNPLILSCLIGIGINISQITLPLFVVDTIKIIGSIALPLGIMTVGAAFILTNIKSAALLITCSSVLKLVIYPCLAFFIARLFQLDQLTQNILVIFCALPTATASYVLTKSLQGNHQLMARIITLETLLSGVTLFILLKLLNIG